MTHNARRFFAPGFAIALVVFSVMAAGIGVASAFAGQDDAYWSDTVDRGWRGSRATIGNTVGSERSVSNGDFFSTTAYADDGAGGVSLIQIGVNYEYNAPEGPSCDLGASSPSLYYFVEIQHLGGYKCWNDGLAASGTQHLESVFLGGDGLWHAARDSTNLTQTTSWTGCSGHACQVVALGENSAHLDGDWTAKFAGSGNTPWQFNGAAWNTVNGANWDYASANWTPTPSGHTGPFPGGMWTFSYQKP